MDRSPSPPSPGHNIPVDEPFMGLVTPRRSRSRSVASEIIYEAEDEPLNVVREDLPRMTRMSLHDRNRIAQRSWDYSIRDSVIPQLYSWLLRSRSDPASGELTATSEDLITYQISSLIEDLPSDMCDADYEAFLAKQAKALVDRITKQIVMREPNLCTVPEQETKLYVRDTIISISEQLLQECQPDGDESPEQCFSRHHAISMVGNIMKIVASQDSEDVESDETWSPGEIERYMTMSWDDEDTSEREFIIQQAKAIVADALRNLYRSGRKFSHGSMISEGGVLSVINPSTIIDAVAEPEEYEAPISPRSRSSQIQSSIHKIPSIATDNDLSDGDVDEDLGEVQETAQEYALRRNYENFTRSHHGVMVMKRLIQFLREANLIGPGTPIDTSEAEIIIERHVQNKERSLSLVEFKSCIAALIERTSDLEVEKKYTEDILIPLMSTNYQPYSIMGIKPAFLKENYYGQPEVHYDEDEVREGEERTGGDGDGSGAQGDGPVSLEKFDGDGGLGDQTNDEVLEGEDIRSVRTASSQRHTSQLGSNHELVGAVSS